MKAKPRTKEEIAVMVEKLEKIKQSLPEHSAFGDNNWEKIDAQIAVIKGEKYPDDYYVDESSEEYQDGDNELWSDAEQAEQWLNGKIDDEEFIGEE